MISYSKKYNKAGKESVAKNLKDLVLSIDPSVNTFLNTYGYSQVFNAGYIDLKSKLGMVVVGKLPKPADGDAKPVVF
jgi:hypothetical protein